MGGRHGCGARGGGGRGSGRRRRGSCGELAIFPHALDGDATPHRVEGRRRSGWRGRGAAPARKEAAYTEGAERLGIGSDTGGREWRRDTPRSQRVQVHTEDRRRHYAVRQSRKVTLDPPDEGVPWRPNLILARAPAWTMRCGVEQQRIQRA
jgi:hypothetical protein